MCAVSLVSLVSLTVTACGSTTSETSHQPSHQPSRQPSRQPTGPPPQTPEPAPEPVLMPDLVGLPERAVDRRLGELAQMGIDVSADRRRPVVVACEVRPGVVVRQRPAPGTPVHGRVEGSLRLSAIDPDGFRGPCSGHDLGPVAGPDADLVRRLYEFAADPARGAPFVDGDVWVGIEAGPVETRLDAVERGQLSSWAFETGYADLVGPHSALDYLAASGGWYRLSRGIVPTCGTDRDDRPPEMVGLRVLSVTGPPDTASSCGEDGWGVTVFVDHDHRIAGVALRHGSP